MNSVTDHRSSPPSARLELPGEGGAGPRFLFPRGGECVGPGEELLVRFRYEGPARSARLRLLIDGQGHPSLPPSPLTLEPGRQEHSARFTVPIGIEAVDACLQLLVENDQGAPAAVSPSISIVDRFRIELLSPAPDAVLRPGEQVPITVVYRGARPMLLQLWLRPPGRPAVPLGSLPPAAPTLLWTVPADAGGAQLEVMARDADGFEAHYLSRGTLTVSSGPLLAQLTVEDGPLLRPGTEVPVRWEVRGGQAPYSARLEIWAEGSLLWEAPLDGPSGVFSYPVPDIRTDRCEIALRATDAVGAAASSSSGALRVLGRPLQALVRDLGEAPLRVGEQAFIQWDIAGGAPPYSAMVYLWDNGDSLPISSWQEEPELCWTVCNRRTSQARLQVVVRDQAGHEVRALSERPLTIQGFSVRVVSPNGREHVKARQHFLITWESEGPAASFSVNLIIDGQVADEIARDLPSGARSVDWKIPYLPTQNAYIQVVAFDALGRPMADDLSDGSFCISPERPLRVTVVHPNGSPFGDQGFHPGERVQLRWRTEGLGAPRSFKVELVVLDGGERRHIPVTAEGEELPGDATTCEWVVPAIAATDTARIRVYARDEVGYEDSDDSDYYFRILPGA